MKTAVLILLTLFSLVFYGQDKIEYENFEFRSNGDILSMEQVENLTDSLFSGRYRFYLARKQLFVSQSSKTTMMRNLTNFTNSVFMIGYGVGGIAISLDPFYFDSEYVWLTTGSALLTGSGLYMLRFVGRKSNYERRADKNFRRVAKSLNNRLSKETGN